MPAGPNAGGSQAAPGSAAASLLIKGLAGLAVLLPIVMISALLFTIDRGFDVTDEAFMVLNAWRPRDNIGALTIFGHYLNLFEPLIGRNITGLRGVGLLGLLVLGVALANEVLCHHRAQCPSDHTWPVTAVLAGCVIFATFGYYRYWSITPSYSWFALAGAVTVVTGAMRVLRKRRQSLAGGAAGLLSFRTIVLTGMLIGGGGILAIIGRPTTGLALGLVTGLWLAFILSFTQWLAIVGIAAGFCAAFVIAHVWSFEASWPAFVERLTVARDLGATLEGGHTLLAALDRVKDGLRGIPKRFFQPPMLAGLAVVAAGSWLAIRWRQRGAEKRQWEAASAAAIICGLIALDLTWFLRAGTPVKVAGLPGHLGLETLLFIALFIGLGRLGYGIPRDRSSPPAAQQLSTPASCNDTLLIMLLCAMAAMAIPFGSNISLITASGTGYVLYCAGSMLGVLEILPQRMVVQRMALLILIVSPLACTLYSSATHPYRLPRSIFEQNQKITFMDSETVLRVDPLTKRWANGLKKIAVQAGWRAGMPLIDLTGATPGAALVLAGRAPVTPWLVGGYTGSHNYVSKVLSLMDRDVLRSAWILTAPEGAGHISADVPGAAGLAFPAGYKLAGTVRTGYRNEQQFLWKPVAGAQ